MAQTGSRPIDELVRRAIIGDGTAFTELWDSNIGALRAYLGKNMKQLDHFFIEDVCSKTFEKAFRQIRTYDPSLGRFDVWLKRIARNTAFDVIEQEARRQRSYVSIDEDSRSLLVADTPDQEDPLDEVIRTEARKQTGNMVDRLPELYRDIARLRLLEGMQYKEISEETGLELNTVRTRIRRAKILLDKMKNLVILLVAALGISLNALAADIIPVRTAGTALIMSAEPGGTLNYRHYGPTVAATADYAKYDARMDSHTVGDPFMYPSAGGKFTLEPALAVTYADGTFNTELKYESYMTERITPDMDRTVVRLRDAKQPLRVELIFEAYRDEDVIVTHAVIYNDGAKNVVLRNYYSACMPLYAPKYTVSHFYGMWAREWVLETETLTRGSKTIEDREGVQATQKSNPSFMLGLGTGSIDERTGDVIAGALCWSGNYKINFQVDESGRLYILSGMHPAGAEYTLEGKSSFVTPDMVWTYSTRGAGQASRNLHDWARGKRMYSAATKVPTLLNSWEGAYFSFNTKTLTDMIDDAASLGLEMFVLDDGWFGRGEYARNGDDAGLGDWQLNEEKIPEGIGWLAEYAHSKGLKFGIWIEPEMVNPRSQLYQAHPEWVVNEPGRELYQERNQLLLDLSNPAVQDFVFGVFDSVMQFGGVDYVKWDSNRRVYNPGSATERYQQNFWVDYVRGYYSVLERIRQKYPDVLIQSCSSGGGRADYGVLAWTNEFWTSDNTDALTRAYMQYAASLIYPVQVLGSHISATPNHQTGNITPLKFRCDMAASGRLGMEIQPKLLSDSDKEYVREYLKSYKQFRDIVFDGDQYRLCSPYDGGGNYSVMFVSKDGSRAVFFAYCLSYQGSGVTSQFRLDGLDSAARYKVTELNPRGPVKFWGDGMSFGGDYLMNTGLNFKMQEPCTSVVMMIEKL